LLHDLNEKIFSKQITVSELNIESSFIWNWIGLDYR